MTSSRLRRRSAALVLATVGILSSASLLDAASAGAAPVEHERADAAAAASAATTPAETDAPTVPQRDEVELLLSGLGLLGGATAALFLRRRL